MRTKLLLSFLVILIPILNGAAQEIKTTWTLQECVDYAVANNLNVKRSTYGVETNEVGYNLAWWALAPSFNAGVSNGYNWGRSINPVSYQYVTQRNNSINPNASSSVTIFNGLRLQYNIKQTSRDLDASKADLQKTKNDVILNVISLYTNVIFNKELYEFSKSQLSSAQQQLDRIIKQVNAGALSRSNQLNQEAQVATYELNVVTRENSVNLTLLQLKQALQLEAGVPMDVVIPDINVEELVIDQNREEVFQQAYNTMPEIKRDNLKVESSDYAVRAARANLYPRLSAGANLNSNYSSVSDTRHFVADGGVIKDATQQIGTVDGTSTKVLSLPQDVNTGYYANSYTEMQQIKDNLSKSVNLTLTIPILNGMQSRGTMQRAIINKEVALITARQTSNTLRQSVETAFNDALAASKTYASTMKQVNAREEANRMTKQRYESGAANFVEYQLSENDLFQAKSDFVRAKYDFIFKKKLLDFYQGKPIQY